MASINDVYYRAYVQNKGWLDWTMNDLPSGTEGYGLQIEAIEITVLPKKYLFAPKIGGILFMRMNQNVIEWHNLY